MGDSAVGLQNGRVEVRPYHADWLRLGEAERLAVAAALGELAVAVEHVGSTAVPELPAKPIIDIAAALADDGKRNEAVIRERMKHAGYIDRVNPTNGGGWLFVRDAGELRVAHVHLVAIDDPEWASYLRFRDTLRADATARERYAQLKRHLAGTYPDDRVAYTQAKTGFVFETVNR